MTKPVQLYETPEISVTFDPNVCRHTGVCLRGLPAVFDIKRRDWVRPAVAPPAAVAWQVACCPTGALQSKFAHPNKEIIRRWIMFANGGFRGDFGEFIAEDYVGHMGGETMNRAELERIEHGFMASFPDAKYSIDDVAAEGDRVVLRTTARGTHRGVFEGIDPTNRSVEFTAILIYRIHDGKIAESWGEIDFVRLMRQLR